MASTITVPSLPQIQTNVAEIAKQAIAVATAAVTDIEALQASNSSRDWKESVRAATAAALAANTRTGNVLLADANGALGAIDTSVTMVVGDRILIKNEVTAANNGIYTVTTLGAGGSKFSFTRATDADTSAEVTSGLVVQVEEGTANAGRVFELTTANPITLNTTALTFSAFAPGLVQTTDARLAPTPTAAGKMLYDNGTAYVETAAGTAGQFPVTNAGATAPVFVSMSGDAALASTGAITVSKIGGNLVQSGVATLTAGDSGAIAATVTANTRIVISLKTANTTTLTTGYAALSGDRSVGAPGSFNIKAIVAAGTINVADVSTVDWIAIG